MHDKKVSKVSVNLKLFACIRFHQLQGLYPGYIIFFIQSALMIAGSRGTRILNFENYIADSFPALNQLSHLYIYFLLFLFEQSFTDGSKLLRMFWL